MGEHERTETTLAHPATLALIERLCALTRTGAVRWRPTGREETAAFETEGYIIEIDMTPSFRILGGDRQEIEAVGGDALEATAMSDGRTAAHAVTAMVRDALGLPGEAEKAVRIIMESLPPLTETELPSPTGEPGKFASIPAGPEADAQETSGDSPHVHKIASSGLVLRGPLVRIRRAPDASG
jgi:hypothetical protein